MNFSFIKRETENRIASIILARPEKKNAFNDVLVKELKEALQQVEEDPTVKVIMLKAEGNVFSAGADLDYLRRLQTFSYEDNLIDSNNLKELFWKIQSIEKIVIAQVEGHAIAGGCGLATICDFTFAVPEAQFGYSEVRIGFIPALVMVFLLRKITGSKAKELLFTGKLISADEATQIGLINQVVPKEAIANHVRTFAESLCDEASGQSLTTIKKMFNRVVNMDIQEALDYAAEMNASARSSEDCKKGIAAFLNKEKIKW